MLKQFFDVDTRKVLLAAIGGTGSGFSISYATLQTAAAVIGVLLGIGIQAATLVYLIYKIQKLRTKGKAIEPSSDED